MAFLVGLRTRIRAHGTTRARAEARGIATVLFHPDYNRRLRNCTESADPSFGRKALAGLGPKDPYRRWGIAPRPENIGHPMRVAVNDYDETPTSRQAPPPWGTVMRLCCQRRRRLQPRSEEHTSELQS